MIKAVVLWALLPELKRMNELITQKQFFNGFL